MPYVSYNKVTDWTKEKIEYQLTTDDSWVERALIVLYDRQTEREAELPGQTIYKNTVGFQVADAKQFTRFALQIKNGKHLNQMQLAECRRPWHRGKHPIPTIAKYRGQLLQMIEAKAKASRRAQ